MRDIQRAYCAYLDTDAFLWTKESRTRNVAARQAWARKRALNDEAFYVLLFAKLEGRINALCARLITHKKALRHWKARRWWDSVDLDQLERVPFMQRAALLLDRNSHHRGDLKELYDIRITIAHGGTPQPIHVPTKAEQMFEIARMLSA